MPLFLKEYDSGSASAEVFPLQGWQYEYLPWDAEVEVAVIFRESSGTFTGEIPTYSCYSGSDLLAQSGTQATKKDEIGVQYPYDYNLQDIAAAGERIGIQLLVPASSTIELPRTKREKEAIAQFPELEELLPKKYKAVGTAGVTVAVRVTPA